MDVSGVSASAYANPAQAQETTTVANEVHKKALEVEEQTATALIEAIPDPDSSVGQNIDIKV